MPHAHRLFRLAARAAVARFISLATKAFLCRAAAALAVEEGLHIDVASAGELTIALSANVPPDDITLHGNYKKDAEILEARLT